MNDPIIEGLTRVALNTKTVLTQEECAQYTGLSMAHLYTLVSRREIPHSKCGNKSYFVRTEIEEWLTRNRIPTKEELERRAQEYVRTHPLNLSKKKK